MAPVGRAALGRRRHVPTVLLLVGMTILVVALARPQAVLSLPRLQGTVVLAFDVSGSMAATDFRPTRMEAAKSAARAFVERQPTSVQIGVVAFSDGGLTVQAPTADQGAVLAAIDRLGPQRGTSLGSGHPRLARGDRHRRAAPNAGFYTNRPPEASPSPVPPGSHAAAAIVLLSDGENNEAPDPLEAAAAAAAAGIRIYTVGHRQRGRHDPGGQRLPRPHAARRGHAPADRRRHGRHVPRRERHGRARLDLRGPPGRRRHRAPGDRAHVRLRGRGAPVPGPRQRRVPAVAGPAAMMRHGRVHVPARIP